jgi:hypothetical protein
MPRACQLVALSWVTVGLLAGCDEGPRRVVAGPAISNIALGQDVPDDNSPSSAPAVIRCADPLHQNRPGGSDYKGPPIPECPRQPWYHPW